MGRLCGLSIGRTGELARLAECARKCSVSLHFPAAWCVTGTVSTVTAFLRVVTGLCLQTKSRVATLHGKTLQRISLEGANERVQIA